MNPRDGDITRDRIETAVRELPGITPTQLCEVLELGWGTVNHHLNVLERVQERIHTRKAGRNRRIYIGSPSVTDTMWLAQLQDDVCTALLSCLRDEPEMRLTELADAASVSRKVARRHLSILDGQGVVSSRGLYQRHYRIASGVGHLRNLLPQIRVSGKRE